MLKHHSPAIRFEELMLKEREAIRELLPSIIYDAPEQSSLMSAAILEPLKDLSFLDASLVILDELIDYITQSRCSHTSPLMDYFSMLNHLPVVSGNPWERELNRQLQLDYVDHTHGLERFNALQLQYLILDLGKDGELSGLQHPKSGDIEEKELRLYLLNELCVAHYYQAQDLKEKPIAQWLKLINVAYFHEGSDPAIYMILRWLTSLNWGDRLDYKKALLDKLTGCIKKRGCPNAALVLYEKFSLPDRQVSAAEKYRIFKQLIKHQHEGLNEFQLQGLYFFAGNYPTDLDTSFKESILFYQHSNYYLHKCWDRIRSTSVFLRTYLSPKSFFILLPNIERRVYDLGNQISLQNNAYVETLQADYSKIEALYRQVEELSLTDSLTGLRNRRYLQSNVYHMIHLAARHKVPICFAMIDIDHFKDVNDAYGHLTGDYVLKEIAKIITRDFRKSDLIVRYGGEEFLMLLFDTVLEHACRIMDEVRLAVMKHEFHYRGAKIEITISVGVSEHTSYFNSDFDIGEKIAEADKALYTAKNTGRNRVCF